MSRIAFIFAAALAAAGCNVPAEQTTREPAPSEDAVERRPPSARADSIPAAFHGVWDRGPEACGAPSDSRLTVAGRELRFHESVARVREVTLAGEGSISVAADFEGEGQTWSEVRELRLAESGSRLTVSGGGVETTRLRCP